MTEEMKTHVDDFKDFAQQAKLEVKKKARSSMVDAELSVAKATGAATRNPPTTQQKLEGAQHIAKAEMANVRDLGEQVALEAKIRGRDAKLAFDQSAAGAKINDAAAAAADSARSAKEGVLDAVLPTQKVVEATSTRGVNITHVENPRNDRIAEQRAEEAAREAALRDREKEKERQAMLNSAKATISEKTQAASAALTHAKDKATVVLGQAALSLKDKVDELELSKGKASDGQPKPIVLDLKTSDRGVDISSMSNPNNEELLAREERQHALAAAKAPLPTLGDKAAAALSKAGDSIKAAWTEATTDAPAPLYTAKTSERGVDISSAQNPANAELSAAEQRRLEEQKARELAREKAVVQEQVDRGIVAPAKADAREVKEDLGAQLSALGQSVSAAASRLGHQVADKWDELTNPAPINVHEKKSDNGIDTTSIANANNHALGEQIKREHAAMGLGAAVAPSKEQAVKQGGVHAVAPTPALAAKTAVAPDTETAVIKSSLDSGVAVRDTKAELGQQAQGVKADAALAAQQIKQEISKAGDKIAEKIGEMSIAPTAV